MPSVKATIPARAEFVKVLRGVVSSVAARMQFGFEEIEDLRLAVDEACAHLLAAAPAPDRIHLTVKASDGSIDVVARRDTVPEAWPPDGARRTLAWRVLSALTDEARFEDDGDGAAISFRKGSDHVVSDETVR